MGKITQCHLPISCIAFIMSSSRGIKHLVTHFYTLHEELAGLTKLLLNPLALKEHLKSLL